MKTSAIATAKIQKYFMHMWLLSCPGTDFVLFALFVTRLMCWLTAFLLYKIFLSGNLLCQGRLSILELQKVSCRDC